MTSPAEEELAPIVFPSSEHASGPLKVSNWLVEVGDEVLEGEHLVEVIIPGMLIIVDAPVNGVLEQITVAANASFSGTATLGLIKPTPEELTPEEPPQN